MALTTRPVPASRSVNRAPTPPAPAAPPPAPPKAPTRKAAAAPPPPPAAAPKAPPAKAPPAAPPKAPPAAAPKAPPSPPARAPSAIAAPPANVAVGASSDALVKRIEALEKALKAALSDIASKKTAGGASRTVESRLTNLQGLEADDWRLPYHGLLVSTIRFDYKDLKRPDETFYLKDDGTRARTLLCIPRDDDAGDLGPHEREGGRIAAYVNLSEDGTRVFGAPTYITRSELMQILTYETEPSGYEEDETQEDGYARDAAGEAIPIFDLICDTRYRDTYFA